MRNKRVRTNQSKGKEERESKKINKSKGAIFFRLIYILKKIIKFLNFNAYQQQFFFKI